MDPPTSNEKPKETTPELSFPLAEVKELSFEKVKEDTVVYDWDELPHLT
jgi:hypothetical protein